MMGWWNPDHMGTGGWIGMGFMIVFWIAVVVGIIYLVRYLAVRPSTESGQAQPGQWLAAGVPSSSEARPEALRILEERYARGEIDREEFLGRRADLLS